MKLFVLLTLVVVSLQILTVRTEFAEHAHHDNGNVKSTLVTNLTVLMGETVFLNCSLKSSSNSFLQNSFHLSSLTTLLPTWLKADGKYDQSGEIVGFKNENIIVTRKGVIADVLKEKVKLVLSNDKVQSLKITNINAKDEGKYICREFNSDNDKIFYLKVYASVSGLSMKFHSPSKFFRYTSSNYLNRNAGSNSESNSAGNYVTSVSSSIAIRENDELFINCTVNNSKPAADLTLWLAPSSTSAHDEDIQKLDVFEFYATRNKDYTMKSVAVARYKVNRNDNQKSIICIAENLPLDEKWETKRALNVLYPPQCSQNQRLLYHTGINQTIELECRMTDANPPSLEFSWNFVNNFGNREKTKSNGHVSKISWTPRSRADFGQISCLASNNLDSGECKIIVELGGPPNPPEGCHYKENNATVIIECTPGFDQGDPEMYYYLMKKKTNGVLLEYARKRDSCSFLISKSILEEYESEFFVYSSNKYGSNKETAVKLVILNEDILLKNSKKGDHLSADSRTITIIVASVCSAVVFLGVCCCLCIKCAKSQSKASKSQLAYDDYREKPVVDLYEDHHPHHHINNNFTPSDNQILEHEKLYSSIRVNKEKIPNGKNLTTTFMMKDIQDLDASPISKRRIAESNEYQRGKYKSELVDDEQHDGFYFSQINHSKEDNGDDSSPETELSNYYIYNTVNTKYKKKEPSNVWYADEDDDMEYENYGQKAIKKSTDYSTIRSEKLPQIDSITNTNSYDMTKKNSKYGILV